MLASPLVHSAPFSSKMPSSTPEDSLSFRPARDVESFNSLLPPPIEFVEGSSSGALAVPEGKYQPINVSPQHSTKDRLDGSPIQHKVSIPVTPTAPPAPTSPSTPSSVKNVAVPSTSSVGIDLSWPETYDHAAGLYNTGNTCFLNSALQCLLHTPPLLRVVIAHGKDKCHVGDKFCMVCAFRQVTLQAHKSSSPFSPHAVSSRLLTIAKHMRRGRQEDSHEFLRYAIDAMQKACLHGVPQKLEAKLAESTWVHKIFGGKLRSRVSCQACGHNSDTFDRILDLSLDIIRSDSLKEALKSFISPDYLKGSDKYKCEKCKKHVNAEKRFTIHEAPAVLTVHLKRFSPLGRKIGHHVTYDETLHLQPYMSKDQFGPTYSLYGVICHAGGGPNSGHYYAFVKSRTGKWYEMNDEMVSPIGGPPVNKKTAYMLFYLRNKGQGLQALVKGVGVGVVNGVHRDKDGGGGGERMGLISGMKKRRERGEDGDGGGFSGEKEEEDVGERVTPPRPTSMPAFIGPLLPSPMDGSIGGSPTKKVKVHHGDLVNTVKKSDPQAEKVKQKIQAAQEARARKALAALEGYESSSTAGGEEGEEEDKDKDTAVNADKRPKIKGKVRAIVESDDDDEDDGKGENANQRGKSSPPTTSPPPSSPSKHVPSSPIPTNNFYGPSFTGKKAPTSPHVNGRIPSATHDPHLRFDDDSSGDDNDTSRRDREEHGDRHSKKHKKLEGTKMRMSMEPNQALSRRKGYVNNPFTRLGSENSAASRGAGGNGTGTSGGRINTYGKRRTGRARGL